MDKNYLFKSFSRVSFVFLKEKEKKRKKHIKIWIWTLVQIQVVFLKANTLLCGSKKLLYSALISWYGLFEMVKLVTFMVVDKTLRVVGRIFNVNACPCKKQRMAVVWGTWFSAKVEKRCFFKHLKNSICGKRMKLLFSLKKISPKICFRHFENFQKVACLCSF